MNNTFVRVLRVSSCVAAAFAASTLFSETKPAFYAIAPVDKQLAKAAPEPTRTVRLNGGTLFILTSGHREGIRNPVFVVEGFDLNNSMGWPELYALLNRESLVETLLTRDRDLIVLDFDDATDSLLTNGSVVLSAIQYINALRGPGNDAFVVIGASMGGLLTRYALSTMERYPALYGESRVNTWISFDSPHEGANIPLSLQELVAFAAQFTDYSQLAGIVAPFKAALDSPAAQQMLSFHYSAGSISPGRSPQHAWIADYFQTTIGYPTACRTVAISNGSGKGVQQPYAPGDDILFIETHALLFSSSFMLYAMPQSGQSGNTLFYGYFNPLDLLGQKDWQQTTTASHPSPLDHTAGGTNDSFAQFYDAFPALLKWPGSYCRYDEHCFIPVNSSIGKPAGAFVSPFDEIHLAEINEPHVEINARNKILFIQAVLGHVDADGDGVDDFIQYRLDTDTGLDSDGDGMTDLEEEFAGTDPFDPASKLTVAYLSSGGLAWEGKAGRRYQVYSKINLSDPWQAAANGFFEAETDALLTYSIQEKTESRFFVIRLVLSL